MQTIIVDMTPGFRMPTIYYSQGDVGTQFAIDLRSRFGDSFPTGTTVTIQATKPSGFGFSVVATSVTNGVATFTTTAEMTDEFGRFPAELKVTKTGLTLFTANFYMDGERNTHPEGTTDGSQETVIPELTQLVERVEDAASSVLDMTVNATTLAAGSQATYSYDEETNTATFGIPKGADGSLASGVLAPTYSSSSTYAVGDYVYYSGSLYRCTTAITTAEAWTSGHWTQVALAPEVSDLKSEISEIDTTAISQNNFLEGYYLSRQGEIVADKNYCVSAKIPVLYSSGLLFVFGTNYETTKINLCEYDALGNLIDYWGPGSGGATERSISNLNANTKYVRFSYVKGYADACLKSVTGGAFTAIYWKPHKYGGEVTSKVVGDKPKEFSTTVLSANGIKLCHNSLKSPRIYAYAKFSAFAGIYIGHGESGTYTQYFKIDNTNVTFYTHGTEGSAIAHGLTIDTYIGVTIDVNYDCSYRITIHTLGGSWSREMAYPSPWLGYKGETFIKAISGTTTTFTAIGYVGKYQFTKWMFGDSYLSNYSDARWPYYLSENDAEYTMINAFPGENSKEAYLDWIDALNNGTPKYAIWCLGMNDADSGAVNSDWLAIVQMFLSDCQQRGITPILATIPNVPTIDHTYKNAWVKASGYRYIDFAEAVGAESSGSTWYTDCLETATPRIHPTTDGARLLYMRAITDFPEFLQE